MGWFSLLLKHVEGEQDKVGLGSLFSLMKQMSGDMGEFRADMVKIKEDITGLRD